MSGLPVCMPPFSPAWENIHALFRTQATEEETEDFPLILIQFGAATSHGLYGHSGDRRKAPSHGYGF